MTFLFGDISGDLEDRSGRNLNIYRVSKCTRGQLYQVRGCIDKEWRDAEKACRPVLDGCFV